MRDEEELLAAYVDGVSELTTKERRRVEALLAREPAARDDERATRALLGQLRELAPEGNEPDFAAMERAIRSEVGPTVPRSWRPWRWLVPISTFAMAAAVLLLWIRHPEPAREASQVAQRPVADMPGIDLPDAGAAIAQDTDSVPLWLDGAAVEVDLEAFDLLGGDETRGDLHDEGGLLPSADLAAVDELSPEEADRIEQWLAKKKS